MDSRIRLFPGASLNAVADILWFIAMIAGIVWIVPGRPHPSTERVPNAAATAVSAASETGRRCAAQFADPADLAECERREALVIRYRKNGVPMGEARGVLAAFRGTLYVIPASEGLLAALGVSARPGTSPGDLEDRAALFRSEVVRVADWSTSEVGDDSGAAIGWLGRGSKTQQANKLKAVEIVMACSLKTARAPDRMRALHACEDLEIGRAQPAPPP